MLFTWSMFNLLLTIVYPACTKFNYLSGTLVRLSHWFWLNLTSIISVVSVYSSIDTQIVFNWLFTSILPDALMSVFLDRVVDIQQWMPIELVIRCNTTACHQRAKLIPSMVVSNSVRLICLAFLVRCKQKASSTMLSSISSATPVVKESASTCPIISSSVTY